ncbi:phage capsid protein [Alcaligenaceae bacterium]|nr:phage capsid protein [Alcaligenaceae bacterium]
MGHITLSMDDASYASMTKIGKIEVQEIHGGDVMIVVGGFEFSDLPTCRMHTTRAMAWLRDVLDAKIKLQQLSSTPVRSAVD